jgi:hypothetical protein
VFLSLTGRRPEETSPEETSPEETSTVQASTGEPEGSVAA